MKRLLKRTTIICAAFAIGIVMVLLGGCGQQTTATLEDIAAKDPDVMNIIEKEITTPDAMTSEVTFSGDSFDITYTFKDPIDDNDEKVLVKAFGKNSDKLKESFEKALADLEEQTGITGITGTVHIVNSSGDETWTKEFPEKE